MNSRPRLHPPLPTSELLDMMARQSLDVAIEELGPAECLRIIAERIDPELRPSNIPTGNILQGR